MIPNDGTMSPEVHFAFNVYVIGALVVFVVLAGWYVIDLVRGVEHQSDEGLLIVLLPIAGAFWPLLIGAFLFEVIWENRIREALVERFDYRGERTYWERHEALERARASDDIRATVEESRG